MSTLTMIPHRGRLDVVLIERRGAGWVTGVGPIAFGHIMRRLEAHPTEEAARSAAVDLADRLDMLALMA